MAKMFSVDVSGSAQVQKALQALGVKAPHALGQEYYEEAVNLKGEAMELTPVLTGELRRSGHSDLPKISGGHVTVEAGFGNAASQYALFVHENLKAHHPRGGQAKYLEVPFNKMLSGLPERVAKGLRRQLKETR